MFSELRSDLFTTTLKIKEFPMKSRPDQIYFTLVSFQVESWNQSKTPDSLSQGETQTGQPSVYETVVLSIIPPSHPVYTSSPSFHPKLLTSLNSPSPSSSELVSSESSSSHPASVSILSSDYPTSNRSSDYDNHR